MPNKVVLLVTAETPEARRNAHLAYVSRATNRAANEVQIIEVGPACEKPSDYAMDTQTYLYADSAVTTLSNSLKLVRDIAEQWYVLNRGDIPMRTAPLYRCRISPKRR